MPVVALTGMRQTGKSIFLRNQAELQGRRYVTLDDFAQLAAAKEDPERFVAVEEPLTIDEAQRCPELFVAMKAAVDRKRVPGRYIISGSADFLLMKYISESLAGRAAYFTMHPFTLRELDGATPERHFLRRFFEDPSVEGLGEVPPISTEDVLTGGMPPVCLGGLKDRAAWFRAEMFFWNIQGRHEVDRVIEAGNRCIAVEVKAAGRWENRDLAGLNAFVAATPHCAAGVLAYNGSTPVRLGDRLWAIPLRLILS